MRLTSLGWLLVFGALGPVLADESPSLIDRLLGIAGRPLAEVRKATPIEASDGARDYALGLGLDLEGVDTIRGVYLPGGHPAPRLAAATVVKFGGVRLRMTDLTIDRLTFPSTQEALVFAHRVDTSGGAVIEVRGKGLVILSGPVLGDPELVGDALRGAWSGSRFTDHPRTLLSVQQADGGHAELASRRGTKPADRDLLEQVDRDTGGLRAHQAGTSGEWAVVWEDDPHEQVFLVREGQVRSFYRAPLHLVSSHGPSTTSMLEARGLLRDLVRAAPMDVELPPSVTLAPPVPANRTAAQDGAVQRLGAR